MKRFITPVLLIVLLPMLMTMTSCELESLLGLDDEESVTISGMITGASNVTVRLSGDDTGSYTVASDGGEYEFNVDSGGTYTITPYKQGYTFSPVSKTWDDVGSDVSQDFSASEGSDIPSGQDDPELAALERRAFDLVNQHRVSIGLDSLAWSEVVANQCRIHSDTLAENAIGLPSHDYAHGGFAVRVENIGMMIDYISAGENVAYNMGYEDPAYTAYEGWLNSPGHRENIETPEFNVAGMGVGKNDNGEYYFTQVFVQVKPDDIPDDPLPGETGDPIDSGDDGTTNGSGDDTTTTDPGEPIDYIDGTSPTGESDAALAEIEKRAFELVNQHRVSIGLDALVWNDVVAVQCRSHSQDMADGTVPFSHDGFNYRADAIGQEVKWYYVGENVAYNYGYEDPAYIAYDGWLKSEGHRENIETAQFNESAMGVSQNSDGEYYLTQMFIDTTP